MKVSESENNNEKNESNKLNIGNKPHIEKEYKDITISIKKDKSKTYYELKLNGGVLCSRSYSDFEVFYNSLLRRYPHCVIPKFRERNIIISEDDESLENRRKEFEYLINRLYSNETINKEEEFKNFINFPIFDSKYYSNLPKKFNYTECKKFLKSNSTYFGGIANFIGKGIKYAFNAKNNSSNESENFIMNKTEEYEKKLKIYKSLVDYSKNLITNTDNEIKFYKNLEKGINFLSGGQEIINENNPDISSFEKLSDLTKQYMEKLKKRKVDNLEKIYDRINFFTLDLEGALLAIQRYNNFLDDYNMINNIKKEDNPDIQKEKQKLEVDKINFEKTLKKDIEKIENEYSDIYGRSLDKLVSYLQFVNEDGKEVFKFFK